MNQKALNALEYPKIIEKLTEKASSGMGKHLCRTLEPSTDLEVIRTMQVQTRDALTRLFQKGGISFGNVKDIRGSLKRLEIGSSLGILEILAVCNLLENTSRVKAYSRRDRADTPEDSLDHMFEGLSLSHRSLRRSAAVSFPKMRSVTMQARTCARSDAA